MLITIITASIILNVIMASMIYSLSKENKVKEKIKVVYKDKPIEKIVYKDKVVEKVVYKDKIVHQFVKEEPKVSPQKQELLDALTELKAKKKKSKKDQDSIYTIEKILPNIK